MLNAQRAARRAEMALRGMQRRASMLTASSERRLRKRLRAAAARCRAMPAARRRPDAAPGEQSGKARRCYR